MDFSKIRKIFYIIAIISMILSIKNKVLAVDAARLVNLQQVEREQSLITFTIPTQATCKLYVPQFIYDFDNILVTIRCTANGHTRVGSIILSNSNIYFNNTNSYIYGDKGGTYYSYSLNFYNPNVDISGLSLSDFSSYTVPQNANGQIYSSSPSATPTNQDGYALYGKLYDYTTKELIINYSPPKYPKIANTLEQLENLDFDVLSINAWDYSNEDFDILFYDLNYGSDTTSSLYPINVITLNKDTLYYNSDLTADPDTNAIYWIPIEDIGFNWVKGNEYGIKFAVRDYEIHGGGGFRGDNYIYNYIGDEVVFTVSNNIPDNVINALNSSTQNNIQNTQHEEIINNMNNIENNLDNLNNALTNTTPDNSVSSDIDNALSFNNENEGLNNLNNGFFSRLTSMLSNLLGYNLADDTSVSIPLPHSNKSLTLHSIDIYNNVTGALRLIINAFWVYIFSFYMWKFINKIYIAISTGNILDTFSSSGEAITNDML